MPGGPIWYELMTPDPGGVAPFYREVLGWEIPAEGHSMPNGSEYREIRRGSGGYAGGVLSLTSTMSDSGMQPHWVPYFHTQDVDAAVAKTQELGGQVHMPATTMEGVGRMAMVTDAQGASFYLMDPVPPPGDPNAQSDAFDAQKPGHCRWNELNTTDAGAASEFYPALLGWTLGMAMPMGPLGDYQFVEVDGVAIGAINPDLGGERPHWLPIFGVKEVEAAKAAVEATGGRVTQDLQEIPGGEFAFTATDPSGAALGLVGPKGA
ncbi:VOC family protein [Croceibacterium selenioxidans]